MSFDLICQLDPRRGLAIDHDLLDHVGFLVSGEPGADNEMLNVGTGRLYFPYAFHLATFCNRRGFCDVCEDSAASTLADVEHATVTRITE